LPVVESLWEAVRAFAPAAQLSCPAQIILATRPFRITLESGVLEYHPREETINAAIEHLVFLDVGRLMQLQRPLQVACIVEEFVHDARGRREFGISDCRISLSWRCRGRWAIYSSSQCHVELSLSMTMPPKLFCAGKIRTRMHAKTISSASPDADQPDAME